MKKLISSLLIVIGVFSLAKAQVKPSFGFKAGLNFISLSEDTTGDDATGYHVGAVLHVPIKKLGVMAEAMYSAEGSEDFELNYINVPLMVTYKIVPGLRLHAGPQFKVKVDAKFDAGDAIEAGSLDDGSDFSTDTGSIEDDIKSLNFDGVAGLEYKFPVIGIFAQARYVFGLGDLGDEFADVKQNVFQLSVGYRF